MLYRKPVYSPPPRVEFDPANQEHLYCYADFLKYERWRHGCPFFLEEPYTDIPTMLRRKAIDHFMRPYVELV